MSADGRANAPPEAPPDRLRLGGGPFAVDVRGDRAALAWLVEFLGPSLAPVPVTAAAPDAEVAFRASPGEHERLRREAAAASPVERDAFTLDGSFARVRAWTAADGTTRAHDAELDAFYAIAAGARAVDVVVDRAEGRARIAWLRVVRELATVAFARAGLLPVHGAGFSDEKGAVLVLGPRRSGKTSLLVHALRGGASYLANDRAFVDASASPTARGMATIVALRDGTLDLFPDLRAAYEGARFDRDRTIAECAPGVDRPTPRVGPGFERAGIGPAQLCRLLGASMTAEAPVRALLFPRVDPEARGLVLEPLDGRAALEALSRSLLEPSEPARLSEVFAPDRAGTSVPAETERDTCRRLVERAPSFACRLGRDAFAGDVRAALDAATRATREPRRARGPRRPSP
jgi:hypothetical protein